MTTCLYGGAFDPLHNQHIKIINNLSQQYDQVIILPSYNSTYKQHLFSFEQRLAMLEKEFSTNNKIIISTVEQEIDSSYTADVLEHLAIADITVVIGSDQFNNLDKWYRYNELRHYKFLVISRNLEEIKDNFELDYQILELSPSSLSSTKIRELINENKDISEFVSDSTNKYIKEVQNEDIL